MSAAKLLFLATEDWFVRSHFLPLLRRARAEGYDVAVAARLSGALDGEDVRLIDMGFQRGALKLGDVAGEAASVRALMARERPAIMHAIALKPIALSLLAGAYGAKRVLALTGRGYLGARATLKTRMLSALLAGAMRRAIAHEDSALLVENESDRRWVEGGCALPDARVALMPGAGVDTELFAPRSQPPGPIKVGVCARLVWSKGVDVAVEAVRRLRAEGDAIELWVAGVPDADNPESVAEAELARWRAAPGVKLIGRVNDVATFWADIHIACLPSRGGEGLPRSLLEAAACGKPIVTTDTPGCADFVRAGVDGLAVPPNDAAALAGALRMLAADAQAREAMGAAARRRVEQGYTEAHAADCAAAVWRRLVRS